MQQVNGKVVSAVIPEEVAAELEKVLSTTGESRSKYLLKALKSQLYRDRTLVTCWEGKDD